MYKYYITTRMDGIEVANLTVAAPNYTTHYRNMDTIPQPLQNTLKVLLWIPISAKLPGYGLRASANTYWVEGEPNE